MAPERRWNISNIIPRSPLPWHTYQTVSTSPEESHGAVSMSWQERYRDDSRGRRRFFGGVGVTILVLSVLGLLLSHPTSLLGRAREAAAPVLIPNPTSGAYEPEIDQAPPVSSIPLSPQHHDDPFDSSHYLVGPPSASFRDALHPNHKYVTSWISAGWTNDVMTYINLIYLGIITDRIPIVPMFTPSHIGSTVPPIPFGEVFDVPRLRKLLQRPVIEWWEVKLNASTTGVAEAHIDTLGCWNTWEAVQFNDHFARRSPTPSLLSLDISYTTAPNWIKLIPNFRHDQHSTFWSLAVLAFPEGRQDNLIEPRESPINHVKLPPDEHLLCYDYLYYTCAQQPFEFNFDYSPAWRFAGQHLHWTPRISALADQYIRRTIGAIDGEPTPNWIAVHIRHGDFADWCAEVPLEDCFAPLSVIARRVQEVKEEIRDRLGVIVEHVIMTSDERNQTWWDGVRLQGWFQVDHSETVQVYGSWYPVLIDAAIQSGGLGFVGTDRSTMSILARRRVQSWRDGATRMVKWGRPGSDDH